MSGSFSKAILCVALAVAAAILPGQALATCGGNAVISTDDGAGSRSFIWPDFWSPGYYPGYPPYSEDTPPFGPWTTGVFWALGTGDPAIGSGDDNGAWTDDNWLYYTIDPWYGLFYAGQIHTDWSAGPTIDGCLFNSGATTGFDGDECTVVLLGDQAQGVGYFAVASALTDGDGDCYLDQPGSDGAGNGGPIKLVAIPKPFIIDSSPIGIMGVELTTLAPGMPAEGVYLEQPGCDEGVVVGYRIYEQQTLRGDYAPVDRTRDDGDPLTGWEVADGGEGPAGEPLPLDANATVTISCPVWSDVFLTMSFVFDSGFEVPFVSRNATRVHCGSCYTNDDLDPSCVPHDCDDSNPEVYPGAPQQCDGLNNDCNHAGWPGLDGTNEADDDGDGYSECAGDCDDADAGASPGGVEVCNGRDDDCDDLTDEDGYGEDHDSDGIAGMCDNCPLHPNPGQVDFDSDGIGDACDNCQFHPNVEQIDGDSDAEGDLCDLDDGMIYFLLAEPSLVEWQEESGFDSWNLYRGDLSVLRATGVYTQPPGSNPLAVNHCGLTDSSVADDGEVGTGEVAFFLVAGLAAGSESGLGQDSAGNERAKTNDCGVIP